MVSLGGGKKKPKPTRRSSPLPRLSPAVHPRKPSHKDHCAKIDSKPQALSTQALFPKVALRRKKKNAKLLRKKTEARSFPANRRRARGRLERRPQSWESPERRRRVR